MKLYKLSGTNKLILSIFTLPLLMLSSTVHAFKIDTHLWVAQQVYNDVSDDGQITIDLDGRSISIPVADEALEAVLNHKDAFFMGNIGPDALPDVVAGQMTVHPGIPGGWKTNDWLTHILERSEGNSVATALAYGYMCHASADVFSHTYVNQYSGSYFSLQDSESLVEQRHYALEAYIAGHTPPYLDQNGVDQGLPHTLVTPSDEVATLIRDILIYDPQVAAEYAKEPTTVHLPAYRSYRNTISDAANSDIWREIDVAVVQVIAAYYGYNISAEQAEALVDFLNDDVIPAVQAREDLSQERVNRINEYVNRIDAAHIETLNSTVERINSLQRRIHDRLMERARLGIEVCKEVSEEICKPHPWPISEICEDHTELVCDVHEDQLQAIARIDEELNGEGGLRDQQLQTLNELHAEAVIVKDTSLRMHQSIIDLAQIIASDTSPAKALLENWVNDLDVALKEYVKAAANTMIGTMDPDVGNQEHGAVTPMVEWYDCYHLTLMGVPAPVGTGECGFRGDMEANFNALQNISTIIQDATSLGTYVNPNLGLPTPAEIRTAVDRLQEEAKQALIDAAIDEFEKLLPDEARDIIDLMSEEMTDSRLQFYYSKEETSNPPKNLIMIPDIDNRIKAEMNIPPNSDGNFDADSYAVIYNSVVLAKLSMLDNAGLNRLAELAGVPSVGGAPLFNGVDNIIVNSVASIDGNHQWMDKAPPYPSSVAGRHIPVHLDASYPNQQSFAGPDPLRLWHPQARDRLFRGLFIGPLSPGIDAPEELPAEYELTTLLPGDYPYRPCNANPFPDGEDDRRCGPITPPPGGDTNNSPIVATAYLDSHRMACAWYDDHTVSCGTVADLDSKRPRRDYSLPPGYTPHNIIDIAWVDSRNMACAWYDNGAVSCGKTYDLDSERPVYNYTLPPGYRPSDIRGVAWVSNHNMACALYDDNRYSCGRTNDLDQVSGIEPYTLPIGYTSRNILSAAWVTHHNMGCLYYDTGYVSCGQPSNMGLIRRPHRYSIAQ